MKKISFKECMVAIVLLSSGFLSSASALVCFKAQEEIKTFFESESRYLGLLHRMSTFSKQESYSRQTLRKKMAMECWLLIKFNEKYLDETYRPEEEQRALEIANEPILKDSDDFPDRYHYIPYKCFLEALGAQALVGQKVDEEHDEACADNDQNGSWSLADELMENITVPSISR